MRLDWDTVKDILVFIFGFLFVYFTKPKVLVESPEKRLVYVAALCELARR